MMNRMSGKILRFFETGTNETEIFPNVGVYLEGEDVFISTDNSIIDISNYGMPNNLVTLGYAPAIDLLEGEVDKDDCVIVKNRSTLSKYMEYNPDRIVLPFKHNNISIPLDHTRAICTIISEMYPKEKFFFYIDGAIVKIAVNKKVLAAVRTI